MSKNLHLNISAVVIVLICLATAVLNHTCSSFANNYWRFVDCIYAAVSIVAYYGYVSTYFNGINIWYNNLLYWVLGSLVTLFSFDAIHCTNVYFHYETYTASNLELNKSCGILYWMYLTVIWAIFNFLFFCIIMPGVPEWLHKK